MKRKIKKIVSINKMFRRKRCSGIINVETKLKNVKVFTLFGRSKNDLGVSG